EARCHERGTRRGQTTEGRESAPTRGQRDPAPGLDLLRVGDGTAPTRLVDIVEDCSKQAFKTWLAERPGEWSQEVEAVAMDGFTGFTTAAAEEVPDAAVVMDLFQVVHLVSTALDQCR